MAKLANKEGFLRVYLAEFFIDNFSVDIYNKVCGIPKGKSALIMFDFDVTVLKTIVTSYLIKDKHYYDYRAINFMSLLSTYFREDAGVNEGSIARLIEKYDLLIMYDTGELINKKLSEVVSNVITGRACLGKTTLLLLTNIGNRSVELRPSVLDLMTMVDLRGAKVISSMQESSGGNGSTTKIY